MQWGSWPVYISYFGASQERGPAFLSDAKSQLNEGISSAQPATDARSHHHNIAIPTATMPNTTTSCFAPPGADP